MASLFTPSGPSLFTPSAGTRDSLFALRQPEQEPGFISSILDDLIINPIRGSGKILGGTLGSGLELLGIGAPITLDDVTSKDVRGAVMLGALAASGGVASLVRGGVTAAGVASPLARLSLTEAAAGSAFGLLRPLDEGEDRINAVAIEGALGAAFGLGFGMTTTAIRRVLNSRNAKTLQKESLQRAAKLLDSEVLRTQIRESAGIVLSNPETGAKRAVRRLSDGRLKVFDIDSKGNSGSSVLDSTDFQSALTEATSEGFIDNLGIFEANRDLKLGAAKPRKATLEAALSNPDFMADLGVEDVSQIAAELGPLQLSDYVDIKRLTGDLAEVAAELDTFAAEVVLPSNAVGTFEFAAPKFRHELLTLLPIDNDARRALQRQGDVAILREGIRQGVVDFEIIDAAVRRNDLIRQIAILDNFDSTKAALVTRRTTADAILPWLRVPSRLARSFPEVKPLVDFAGRGLDTFQAAKVKATTDAVEPFRALSKDERVFVAQTIDESLDRVIDEIGEVAIETTPVSELMQLAANDAKAEIAARATRPEVADAASRVIDYFADARQRAVASGLLGSDSGVIGYFPILNTGKYRVGGFAADGSPSPPRFADTQEEAKELLRKLIADGEIASGGFAHKAAHTFDTSAEYLSPAAFGKVTKKLEAASEIDVEDILIESGIRPGSSRPRTPRKSNFKQRLVGFRDIEADPLEALEHYAHSAEFNIAMNGLETEAARVKEILGPNQTSLAAWVDDYVDRVKGNPTRFEMYAVPVMERMGADAPSPLALRKYSAVIRQLEGISKLSGVTSGLVNMTQTVLNTGTKVGLKWTARAISDIRTPARARKMWEELIEAGVKGMDDVTFLTDAGLKTASKSIRETWKDRRHLEAFGRITMYPFIAGEKFNRVVAGRAAYLKKLDELGGAGRPGAKSAAAAYATEIIADTQFTYRADDLPTILQGPLAGVLLQFKSFIINEVEFVASLNGKELTNFMALMTGLGGVGLFTSMPGVDILDLGSKAFFDKKFSETVKTEGAAIEDPVLRRIHEGLAFGVPGFVFGVDITDFAGIGSVSEITRNLWGPAVSDAKHVYDFIGEASVDLHQSGRVSNETKNRLFQRSFPSVLRRIQRGMSIFESGEVRNFYDGKLVYKPEHRALTATAQIIGFPTIRQTQERILDNIIRTKTVEYRQAHSEYARSAATALRKGDRAEANRILKQANASGHPISDQTLKYWRKELERPASERRLRIAPVGLRKSLLEEWEATGFVSGG